MKKSEILDAIIELGKTIDDQTDDSPVYMKVSKELAERLKLHLDNVAFTEYDPDITNIHGDGWIWADDVRAAIHGFEQEDGKVVVHKNGKLLKGKLKNKEAFFKKYFTEAI
jgi:hypothetical protein